MANEKKYLNTRIQLKYDILANWTKNDPELLAGELAVVSLGNSHTTTTPDNGTHPILFKVGPGKFSTLPFASALAADVYGWAKKETPDWNDFSKIPVAKLPEEALIGDTNDNTTYAFAIVEGKLQVTETPHNMGVAGTPVVTSYDFVTPAELAKELENYYTKSEVDALIEGVEALIPTIPDISASGDDEVTLTANGHTITASHTEHAAGSANTASAATISGYNATGTIKVPKLVTNAAGHVTEISEETITITMPDEQSVSGKDAIKVAGDTEVEVSLALDNSGNVELSQSEAGLKAEIDLSEYAKTADLPVITIADDAEAEIPTENTVNVYKNITANGHVLTEELVQVPTVAGVDASIAANEVFSTDILTVNALGGIAAGADLNGMTTHEILNTLLFPYVAFVLGSTSRSAAAATLENGATQALNSASISITKKSKPITSVKLMNGSTILGEKTGDEVAAGGTITFSNLGITVSKSNNPNLKFTVTDGQTSTDKNVGASTFVYPYYMGECAADATIDETLIESLTKKVESKGNKTVTHSGNNSRMIIAYPKAHGVLKSILDPNNFETIGDYTRSEVPITGLDGTTQTYYVYASGAATVSGFKVQYKY